MSGIGGLTKSMNLLRRIACALLFLATCQVANAQHCAPIYESYLSEISVKNDKDRVRFRLEYLKSGGASKEAYQAYVLAYLEKDAARLPASAPKDVIDKEAALVLHTQLIRRSNDGGYDLELTIKGDEFAKRMIEHGQLTEKDRTEHGGWGVYNDRIRLAVFVPFLEDVKYSVIEGLPQDRHECNYRGDRALLFQVLPYRLSIHFGIVEARRIAPGTFRVAVNGDKPPGNDK
jgi:hypothetical protein